MNFARGNVKNGKLSICGYQLDVANLLDDADVKSCEGREVVFGFRPEAILLGEQENSFVFKGKVQLTELLGDNTNVYIDMDDTQLILKVDPHDTPEDSSEITFSVPYASSYLFDGESEYRIEGKK